jgi:succinate dehydrogenase/fumarate reductase-like Fe-S protein
VACRDRLREGDEVGPLSGLPVVRDLVIDRAGIAPQLRQVPVRKALPLSDAWASLGRCIDCLACVADCPLHLKNDTSSEPPADGYRWGNPMSLLKLQRARLDEEDDDEALTVAIDLGLLTACADCRGCRCGVGIRLVDEVIDPLLAAAEARAPGSR